MDTQNNQTADSSWLDEYPVEVLEAVLQILRTQRDKGSGVTVGKKFSMEPQSL